MSQTDERRVTADGTTLGVRNIGGEGNPIVALHGFTGNGSTMQPLVEAVRRGRPALLVDCIGHGASDAPTYLEPYSMNSVVDQMLSVIGQQPPGSVHLVGYSMGGRIALSMAARAPWYFASLTILSATPGLLDATERAARYDADQALADRIDSLGVEAFCDWWLQRPLFAPMIAGLDDEQLAATRAQRSSSTTVGLANSLRGTGTGSMPPVWPRLGSLRSPLLTVAGALDATYIDIAERTAEAAPFGQSALVPAAGHALHIENPDVVSRVVGDFLEGCETATP